MLENWTPLARKMGELVHKEVCSAVGLKGGNGLVAVQTSAIAGVIGREKMGLCIRFGL